MFLENLAAGLILATVTGLTIIAYRHPPGYKKIALPILLVSCFFYTVLVTWSFALTHAVTLIRFNHTVFEAKAAIREGQLSYWQLTLPWLAFSGYLLILNSLPKILGLKGSEEDQEPKDKE